VIMRRLDETIDELRSWEGVLRCGLHDASALLLQVGSFRRKIVAGTAVGSLGRALATLRSRLDEIDHFGNAAQVNRRSRTSDREIAQLRDFVERRAGESTVADLPTTWMCQTLSLDLSRALRYMTDPTLCEVVIDAGGELPIPNRDHELGFGKATYVDDPLPILLASDEGRSRLLHYICLDIEIAAAEICAKSIVDAPSMPSDFMVDMARQCWDEVRHAELLSDRIRELGMNVGTFPSDGSLWERYHRGADLRERLAIQHVVQEGNGLDSGVALTELLRVGGDDRTAAIFEYLVADEVNHVRVGNRWVRWLCGDSEEEFLQAVRQAAVRIGVKVPGSAPAALELRLAAGFTPSSLQALLDESGLAAPLHQKTGDRP